MHTQTATNPTPGVASGQAAAAALNNGGEQTGGNEGANELFSEGFADLEEGGEQAGAEGEGGGNAGEGGEGEAAAAAAAEAAKQTPADDLMDYEHEGKTYKVPSALKSSLMLRSDYTQKTQALADQGRTLAQQHAVAMQTVQERAAIHAMDTELQAYANADWGAFAQQDAAAMRAEYNRYQGLIAQRQQAFDALQAKESQLTLDMQRARAKRFEDGQAVLTKEIGWNPQVAKQLQDFGTNKYGFTADEISRISDPRLILVLNDAMKGANAKTTAAAVQTITKAQEVKPAAQINGGKAQPQPKDPAKMTIAQYHAWRNG